MKKQEYKLNINKKWGKKINAKQVTGGLSDPSRCINNCETVRPRLCESQLCQ